MTIKMSLAIPGGAIEIVAANQKELIKEASFWQQLPHTCPVCQTETRLYFKEPNDFQYFGLICTNDNWPKHEMNCGQHKEGGTLYVKDEWQYYDPEQQRAIVVWKNGRPPQHDADAQPAQTNGKQVARQDAPPEPPPVEHREPPPARDNGNPFLPPPLLKQFDDLGTSIHSTGWPEMRARYIDKISEGQVKDAADLSDNQVQRMIDGMKTLAKKRQKVTA